MHQQFVNAVNQLGIDSKLLPSFLSEFAMQSFWSARVLAMLYAHPRGYLQRHLHVCQLLWLGLKLVSSQQLMQQQHDCDGQLQSMQSDQLHSEIL